MPGSSGDETPAVIAPQPQASGRHAARVGATLLGRVRVRLESGHAAVIGLIALLAVAGSLALLRAARPAVEDVPLAPPSPVAASPTATESGGALVVHVAGRVRHPGVVRLPPGSRVIDALEAVGGPDPGVDLTPLNLARVLADGEQVLVGVTPPPAPVPDVDTPAGGTGGGPINLNTATREQLESLPGVGPVLAQRIIDWRERHGRFSAVEELQEVSGIGPRIFEQLADLVTV